MVVKIFRLPICPYCHAVNRYNDVKKTTHDKIKKCRHCKKKYKISYLKGRIILISIVCVVLIIINIFLMKQTIGITIPFLAIGDAVIVLLAIMLFPFMVEYKELPKSMRKDDEDKMTKRKKQK